MRGVLILCLVGLVTPAIAEPALFAGEGLFRPPIEWSTWIRGAYGVEHTASPSPIAARETSPVSTRETRGIWQFGAGIEASLALGKRGDQRLGAWVELRGLSSNDAFVGGELVLTRVPKRLTMFLYEGHGILAVRAGRSRDHETASLSYGYVAPFWLEGPCAKRFFDIYTGVCRPRPERTARYMAGVRLVATATRDRDDPRAWSATFGLEFEPVGALRMNAVARSWY